MSEDDLLGAFLGGGESGANPLPRWWCVKNLKRLISTNVRKFPDTFLRLYITKLASERREMTMLLNYNNLTILKRMYYTVLLIEIASQYRIKDVLIN